jgi:hypothetical protein
MTKGKREATGFVLFGRNSPVAEHPWHAALFHVMDDSYFCGGNLVSKRVVITGENNSLSCQVT